MAIAEQLKILKSGVEEWNAWRKQNDNPENIDLSGTDLMGADLYGAHLHRVNLAGANLSNANLSSAILVEANLTNANLDGAILTSANLICANLNGSSLINTQLTSAHLGGANLSEIRFWGADLGFANLSSAILKGADLSTARIGYSVFGFTDLSTCLGLESVEVEGPCTIDFYTLNASKSLPKSFLLKIGQPKLLIDHLPDFYHDEGIRLYPVFLSHSSENKDFAGKLYAALIAKGVKVFFDEKKMKPGDDIYKGISRGIDHYDKMILVCSEDSLKSWWVDRELDKVLKKERSLYKEEGEHIDLLIPITIDDSIYKWNGPKAEEVQRYVIGDFSNWQDEGEFEKALRALIDALNVDRPEIKPQSFLKRK